MLSSGSNRKHDCDKLTFRVLLSYGTESKITTCEKKIAARSRKNNLQCYGIRSEICDRVKFIGECQENKFYSIERTQMDAQRVTKHGLNTKTRIAGVSLIQRVKALMKFIA